MGTLALVLVVAWVAWLVMRRRSSGGARLPKGVSGASVDRAFDQIVGRFVDGEFGSQFSTSVMLRPTERLIFALPSIQLCEERATKRGATYSGVSVRVMKGVTLRSGTITGGTKTEVTPIDNGTLTLTSHRLVFVGEKQLREAVLTKLISIDALDHGVAITSSGRKKTEYYRGTDVLQLTATIEPGPDESPGSDPKTATWCLTGEEIRKMIQALLAGAHNGAA